MPRSPAGSKSFSAFPGPAAGVWRAALSPQAAHFKRAPQPSGSGPTESDNSLRLFYSNLVGHKQSQFRPAFGKLETLMAPGVRIRSSPAISHLRTKSLFGQPRQREDQSEDDDGHASCATCARSLKSSKSKRL